MASRVTVPRGRHAPPLAVRQDVQRGRLFGAAAAVFARMGYADASAEAISREAGMSKATFYEHFPNKEECLLALFDESVAEIQRAIGVAIDQTGDDPGDRLLAGVRAFFDQVANHPNHAQTFLVEIIGAGPKAAERRDKVLAAFAEVIDEQNAASAKEGWMPRFASPDDSFAIVGAVAELASRQVRLGEPKDIRELEPVVHRLIRGILTQAEQA
jgi:AcrR family transcriptional regulator